ncbi:MAG: cobalt ECF transporter T component CbiQ [Anaerolinea sp.]|nr:cobalt ECF transporter T component CbiQ [Anaerolinea sp.]
MHINLLDQFQAGDSPIHRLDARVKLLGALAFILAAALTPDGAWLAFGALVLLWLALALISDVPLGVLLRRGLVALPFAAAAVTVLFTLPGRPLATLQLPVLGWQLTISDAGLVRFVTILLKSWVSVSMAMLLTAATPFPDLLQAMRGIGIPAALVGVLAFMYRYIFVLADEAQAMLRAREARSAAGPGGQKAGGTVVWRARTVGGMVGSLFVRSLARSERVYQAMVSRGYAGELRWLDRPRMRPMDGVWLAVMLLTLALIQLLARLA